MIITSVVVARFPIYFELALSTSVTDPIEMHIDGLGAFLFDGFRSESNTISLGFLLDILTF